MKCPHCASTSYRKNGHRQGKQNYLCKNCGKQFLEYVLPDTPVHELMTTSNGHKKNSVAAAREIILENTSLDAKNFHDFSLLSWEEIIQSILSSGYLESPAVGQIINQIQRHINQQSNLAISGIAILLLDVENLKINSEIETFLASIASYQLQAKIAFANWKNPSLGKQDIDLYERGYQLVHVPDGKDGADAKMMTMGANLLRYYPNLKEIFVCSGDGILNHLCNELQNQGLTVYWVRRQGQILHIENRNTQKYIYYSLPLSMEIPSLTDVVQQIETLIKTEREAIEDKLNNLVAIANLFQQRCHLEFQHEQPIKEEVKSHTDKATDTNTKTEHVVTKDINSQAELEIILLDIINSTSTSPKTHLSVSKLGTELQKRCGKSPNAIVKKLKLGSSFIKFLQSSSLFTLKLNGKEYEISKSK